MQIRLAVFMVFAALSMGVVPVNAQNNAATASQQDEVEEIVGTVIDAVTKEPIAGVRVEALGNNRYTAMTKVDGIFSIKVPKHVVSLYVSTPGYESVIIKARQNKAITVALYSEDFSSYVENGFDVTSVGEAVIDMAQKLEIKEVLYKMPEDLSGGMKHRVALGRTLLAESNLMILDEPFRGLDEGLKKRIVDRLWEEMVVDKTVIVITHSREDIELLGISVWQTTI